MRAAGCDPKPKQKTPKFFAFIQEGLSRANIGRVKFFVHFLMVERLLIFLLHEKKYAFAHRKVEKKKKNTAFSISGY